MSRRRRRRSSSIDPREEEGFLPPYDPHEEEGFLPPYDPHEEEGFLPPYDPHEEEGFLPPYDPHEEEGFLPPYDPHEEEGFLPPYDPDEWRLTVAARKRRRRRRRPHRRGSHGSAALCGDDLSGRPGNVRTSVKKDYSGAVVIRMAPQYAAKRFDGAGTLQDLVDEAGLTALAKVLTDFKLPPTPRLVAKRGPGPRQAIVQEEETGATDERPEAATSKAVDPTARFDPPPDIRPEEVRGLELEAANRGVPPLHSVLTYWRVDANAQTHKDRRLLLRRLNELAEVDHAYRELAATDPSGGMDTFEGSQGYLDKAPGGIDARWALTQEGGGGDGIRFVDVEQGWIRDHPDLSPTDLLHGVNRSGVDGYTGDHGTAVLGEVAAIPGSGGNMPPDAGTGVAGIAPRAERIGLASHYIQVDDGTGAVIDHSNGHVAEAILAAISRPNAADATDNESYLRAGDVLLLEVQKDYLPTEVDPADFDAIRLATALGIIVVEAAGNGGRDLDAYKDERGAYIFNRRGGGFRDSGAILVGAALSDLPHDRKRASNYGSRVDCYAWGTRVVTTGYGDLGSGVAHGFTADFTNTSAAAPIIAGAALALQGMYRAATRPTPPPDGRPATRPTLFPDGRRLSPGQMRALLADPATGTPQGRGRHGHIGVMPDLRAIAENSLRVVPDVYIRDRFGDTGSVPVSRRVCACPDVLARPREVKRPERLFKVPDLVHKAVTGQDNFVYVQLMNRGRCDAEDVVATVYWSDAATLVTPDRWREIGSCQSIAKVPQGDTPAFSSGIKWHADDVPEPGTYCLIALVEGIGQPTRLPPGLLAAAGARARCRPAEPPEFDWPGFLRFLRDHNHLAIRNVHEIDDLPPVGNEKELPFLITGTPEGDRGRFFDLEVIQELPKDSELSFDVPLALAPALRGWRPDPNGQNLKQGYRRFQLPPLPRVPFCRVPLAAGAAHDCSFNVRVVGGMRQGGHSVAIRQLYRGLEVGRVSWEFKRTVRRRRLRSRSRR